MGTAELELSRSFHHMDTIFALSSGGLPSAVAVVRLSGPRVRFGLETVVGALPPERKAVLRDIRDPSGDPIDRGLVLFFPEPASYTGEDSAEFHLHGGPAVVAQFQRCLAALDGFRSAEPGEFTRRAFENGRLDLTEVEGLADLIAAQTEMQRRQALEQAEGGLGRQYQDWRQRLIRLRALVEADFDFADEEDVPGSVSEVIWSPLAHLASAMEAHLEGGGAGQIIRDGYNIVLLGAPNAGKSSLLNALAKREVAIVSEESGTTRDVLVVHLDLAGYPVNIHDTAGLRQDAGAVEREGMRRALRAAEAADLVLLLEDMNNPGDLGTAAVPGDGAIRVGTKSDLPSPPESAARDYTCRVNVREPDGLDGLLALLTQKVADSAGGVTSALPNRQRHREYLERCLSHLDRALSLRSGALELVAEELRQAAEQLGRLTGQTDVEDLLDVIFREFCIGK